jgi:hypothetical protein
VPPAPLPLAPRLTVVQGTASAVGFVYFPLCSCASSPIASTILHPPFPISHSTTHHPPLLVSGCLCGAELFLRLLCDLHSLLTAAISSAILPASLQSSLLQNNVTMSTAHHSQPPRALRSTRVAANTARPLQPSNLSGSHASAPSSQLHHASTTPATALGSPSSLSLFLRNLRLLDLDLLPDWPGISAETFAVAGPTSAAQGQKKRIQCVEWALFRLFSLWDPDETANVSLCFPQI